MIKTAIKCVARKLGYVISAYDAKRDPLAIRRSLFNRLDVDLVFDVGANAGQFAMHLREAGYDRGIVSFEPMSAAFEQLDVAARQDQRWMIRQCALGAEESTSEINIAGNSWSSSLLGMTEAHTSAAPESAYVDKEVIKVDTLDSLYLEYANENSRPFLKIDTQGYTQQVLDGAQESLGKMQGVLVEMSLVELYVNEPLIGEVVTTLYNCGFVLISVEPEFFDPNTGQLLQVNGLFARA
ncbi:MAG TPA: FkbM family methyltransferase [Gammaproteobacteria bacterium]|nr:FkbM family methyltransferase [Gammaproteobacteria bacterium]